MDVYQMAGVLQANTGTQPYIEDWRTYCILKNVKTIVSDFKCSIVRVVHRLKDMTKGMFRHPVAYTTISSNIQGVRAWEAKAIIKYRQTHRQNG